MPLARLPVPGGRQVDLVDHVQHRSRDVRPAATAPSGAVHQPKARSAEAITAWRGSCLPVRCVARLAKPAVSASSIGQPSRAMAVVTTSRVVPGVGADDAAGVPGQGVDQAALADVGAPARTTCQGRTRWRPTPARECSRSSRRLACIAVAVLPGLRRIARSLARTAPCHWSRAMAAVWTVGASTSTS